ncbi:hypothetical protein HAX54_003822 [Datura stramonium]|uniref:Lipoyl-binding domain-containing protein n=1 Tax=Datura stramonium TaxID=4076 RepID=A0ABS8T5Z2_DATST|nr:hypothetical protein [Datura stramonium]
MGLEILMMMKRWTSLLGWRISYPSGTVIAPMAGLVVKVLVKDAEKVQEGQPVLHVVKAPANGYVRGLEVKVGQSVQDGIKLFLSSTNPFRRFVDFTKIYLKTSKAFKRICTGVITGPTKLGPKSS